MNRIFRQKTMRLISNNICTFARKKNYLKSQPIGSVGKTLNQKIKQLKYQNKNSFTGKQHKTSNQNTQQPSMTKKLMIFIFSLGMSYVFSQIISVQEKEPRNLTVSKSQQLSRGQNLRSPRKSSIKILPAFQAINRLFAGEFVEQIVIQRGFYKQEGGRYVNTVLMMDRNGFFYITSVQNIAVFLQALQKSPIDFKIKFKYNIPNEAFHRQNQQLGKILLYLIIGTSLFVCFNIVRSLKKSQAFNSMFNPAQGIMTGKKFKPIQPQKINTKFADVAGMHEAKSQITQFVDFLKTPQRYIQMGAKVPKGALLAGPPGTGKTLLAKACAGQAGVPFFYVSGSDFVEKYVGLGSNRVRQLFNQAQKVAPSIIFIDQIDAIGKKRDSGPFSNEQRDNTLNQLLVKMDGFDTQNKVIVMGATNRRDMLDPALLRPGRFDRTVEISTPNYQERKQILKVHLQKVKFDISLTIEDLANKLSVLTPGFSGAQLANVCNEAAIQAARANVDSIEIAHFEKAVQRVLAGLQKRNMFSQQEKQLLAYYQSGKAVIGWYTQGADPLVKISILPFSKSNKGYSHSIRDQNSLHTKQQLIDKACVCLSGRAAELHFKGYVSTNGDQDLNRAKRIINYIVVKFGMSQKLKMIAFPDIQFVRKPYSEKIEKTIDQQVNNILASCKQKVQEMIQGKKQKINEVAKKLLEKETLSHNTLEEILGKRPFQSSQNYTAFLSQQEKQNKKKENIEAQGINGEIDQKQK